MLGLAADGAPADVDSPAPSEEQKSGAQQRRNARALSLRAPMRSASTLHSKKRLVTEQRQQTGPENASATPSGARQKQWALEKGVDDTRDKLSGLRIVYVVLW